MKTTPMRRKLKPYAAIDGFILFNRHEYPNGTAAISYDEKTGKPRKQTYAEWFGDGNGFFRNDIGMLIAHSRECHCRSCVPTFKGKRDKYESFHQLWIYPSTSGQPYGEGWEHCNEAEKTALIEENKRMLDLAAKYPSYARAMGLDRE